MIYQVTGTGLQAAPITTTILPDSGTALANNKIYNLADAVRT